MSKRTYPVPNKNLSGSDYIQNKRAKQLFSGTSNLAKTIEQQNGNFPLLTPSGSLKPYQGTYGLSGRSSMFEKTYCLNTSHSYRDLLAITKGKYLLTPPNISFESKIQLKDVSNAQKLYNGLYYKFTYDTTNTLVYMYPGYPDPSANYIPNRIEYNPLSDASQRIIVDPSYVITYSSQSCVLHPSVSNNITINNDYSSRFSFNRTINLDLLAGFQYPAKFSLDYESGDCINANNDVQTKYALPSPPVNITAPVISGNTTIGSTLTCINNGTWVGYPPPTFTYEWYRDTIQIVGQTNNTYVIVPSDEGFQITCHVTGTNASGSAVGISNAVSPTSAPVNTIPPVISPQIPGNTDVGSILVTSDGTWTGSPTPSYSYQWYIASSPSYIYSPIPGKTSNSYQIQPGDEGKRIKCYVTGTNSVTSVVAQSNYITATLAPSNTGAPVISGNLPVPSTLTLTSPGTWNGYPAPTYTRQWYNGAGPITGATGTTYLTQPIDATNPPVKCEVTATNPSGSATADSNSRIPTSAPVNTGGIGLPVISGSTSIPNTLTLTSPGTWNGSATITYTYQWYRNSSLISGATGTSYTTQALADAGQAITCRVRGTNGFGNSIATSNIIVPGVAPTNSVAPLISTPSGTNVGSTITCSTGTWAGNPTPSYSYQWYNDDGPISGATTSSYQIQEVDEGQAITCQVTATNVGGSATATSSNSVTPPPP
jgi:hypothetical protein